MFSLHYYKGFSVFRSFSLAETATIVCNSAYKIGKDLTKLPYYTNTLDPNTIDPSTIESKEKDYVNVVKKVKKENITIDNIDEIMLCQIPGVSSNTALTIMEKYKSIANLIKELDLNPECLNNITCTNAKGSSRKINKTSVTNIVKFLLKNKNI